MKNITISVDDEVYRQARIKAAERGTSVSALVREILFDQVAASLNGGSIHKREHEALLDSIRERHPGFSSADNLSRDELHDRDAIR